MASEGAAVVIDYVGEPTFANAGVQGIQAAGGRAFAVPADVSNPSQVNELVQKTVESFGRLDSW